MFKRLRERGKSRVDAAKDSAEEKAGAVEAATDDVMDKVEEIKEQIEEAKEVIESGAFLAKLKLCVSKHFLCCMSKDDEASKAGAVVDAVMDV